MPHLNANIPVFPAYLKSDFLYNNENKKTEYVLCEVFGITSLTRRCLTFQIMTEYGSRHDRVPIHYFDHICIVFLTEVEVQILYF